MEHHEAFKILVDYFKKEKPGCQIEPIFGLGGEPSIFYFCKGPDVKRLDISAEFLVDSKTPDNLIARLEKSVWKRLIDSLQDGQKVCLTNAGITIMDK